MTMKTVLFQNLADLILHKEGMDVPLDAELHQLCQWEINGYCTAMRIMFPELKSETWDADWAKSYLQEHPFGEGQNALHSWSLYFMGAKQPTLSGMIGN